jgi:hypothetical protein
VLSCASSAPVLCGAALSSSSAAGATRFAHKIDIEVSQASEGAIAAVEAAGGSIKSGEP